MMRKPFVAGNWKMNKTRAEAVALAQAVGNGLQGDAVDVAVIPPFLAIPEVAEVVRGTKVRLGAQDVYFEEGGAFTGEISCDMLKDAGCTFALVGHSERRHEIGETDEQIAKKARALLAAGMDAILCIGETLDEREADKTEEVLERQVRSALAGIDRIDHLTIAYEPVWAIGTGKTATTAQAEQAHLFIRGLVTKLFGVEAAEALRIQYGGSVKPSNAAELMSQPNVDGALVGGASLTPEPFLGIIDASK